MRNHLFRGAAVVALVIPHVASAQETTAVIQGQVTSGGSGVAGASVEVINVPSGTRATATTDIDGNFTVPGLRVGGPYTVSVNGEAFRVTDIFVTAGQPFTLPVEIAAPELEGEIVVTASRISSARNISQGPANVLNAEQISQVASINRDIRDLMRRDPFATLDTSSNTGRNVSFAGQNARFNRFTVDGVSVNDTFGLNPDGLPSRRGPVPLDAIAQFQTKVAPYDVRDGFFQGGIINAVLKSGTNDFEGTAFYSYSSNKLTGDQTKPYITNPTGVVRQPRFKDRDYGIQLSGPIIPDKLFFMIAAERVRANRPIAFGTIETNSGTPVVGLSDATVAQVASIAQSRYGYDAGGILTGNQDKDDRVVARLDANLSDKHRASATFIYTKDEINVASTTSTTQLGLESNAYVKPNEVYAGIAQINSTWSDSFSTEVRGLYREYNSGQFPLLANAAQFTVCTAPTSDRPATPSASPSTALSNACPTGTPQVLIGPGGPSQFNVLRTKTYGGSFVARLTLGNHNVRVLADYTQNDVFNQFVNGGNGLYYFDSIADFQAGNAQGFTYTNAVPSLDPAQGAASFGYQTYTFGIQDDWRISDTLTVSYGARYDLFGGDDRPALNPSYVARYGFANTAYIDGRGLFQARVGFDFRPAARVSIRGGAGIFGGGTPDVYVSNSFANSGVLLNTLTARVTDGGAFQLDGGTTTPAIGQSLLNNVDISNVPSAAGPLLAGGTVAATTSTASLDPDFNVPSQWRATLSAGYRADLSSLGLGDNWNFGVDFLYSKVRDQVLFVDLRSLPVEGSLTPDGRQRYRGLIGATDSGNDIFLTNTSRGRSYIGVVRFDKSFDLGLNIFGSYTWQDVKDQAPATSSIAGSNYNNGPYEDPNRVAYGRSNDEVKWSFKYGIGFDREFFGDYATRFNVFGETRAGSPFSYGFRDNTSSRSTVFGTTGTNTRYLFYVPTGTTDPLVTYDTPTTQARVEEIVSGTGLGNYRGQVAPRNAFRSKSFTKIDLHIEQEVPLPLGARFTVFGDIENVTNLIDNDWGQQLRASFPYNKTVVDVSCVAAGTNTCAQYRYSAPRADNLLADQLVTNNGSSLYAIRIGARISF